MNDPSAQSGGGAGSGGARKNAVVGLREKKIEDSKRSTTPYMTKYERARVLGTRALQIRYVFLILGVMIVPTGGVEGRFQGARSQGAGRREPEAMRAEMELRQGKGDEAARGEDPNIEGQS